MKTKIKDLCKDRNITLTELADRIGTTQTSLSRALGESGNPTLETLNRIADALDVPITELFEQPKKDALQITCPKCDNVINLKVEK